MTSAAPVRPDRRRVRTRRAFFEALVALILERGYDNITVQDIADRADMSRAAFYLHFADKDDLLMKGLREIYDRIVEAEAPFTLASLLPGGHPPCLSVFQQAEDYRDLYRAILSAEGGIRIQARIEAYLRETTREEFEAFIREAGITTFNLPLEVLIQHMGGSLMGLLRWWLMDTSTPYTALDMARLYHRLNCRAWLDVLGIAVPIDEATVSG